MEHVIEHSVGIYLGLLLLACGVGIINQVFSPSALYNCPGAGRTGNKFLSSWT